MDCGNLTDPANGQVNHTAGTTFRQTAIYSCDINLVSPSLARCQVNTVELATNCFSLLMLTWLKSISATDVVYEGKIVQRVAPQKLTAHTDIPT